MEGVGVRGDVRSEARAKRGGERYIAAGGTRPAQRRLLVRQRSWIGNEIERVMGENRRGNVDKSDERSVCATPLLDL